MLNRLNFAIEETWLNFDEIAFSRFGRQRTVTGLDSYFRQSYQFRLEGMLLNHVRVVFAGQGVIHLEAVLG